MQEDLKHSTMIIDDDIHDMIIYDIQYSNQEKIINATVTAIYII